MIVNAGFVNVWEISEESELVSLLKQWIFSSFNYEIMDLIVIASYECGGLLCIVIVGLLQFLILCQVQ